MLSLSEGSLVHQALARVAGLSALIAVFATLPLPHGAYANSRDNIVRMGYDQVVENVDPYFNNVRIGIIIAQHVWDTLIYRDPKTNEYKGQLATSWKWIGDKTLDLDLRTGVKFHDGSDFTADDVVYTLNFVSKPENKSTTQANVNWIESAEKLDSYKVRIHLRRIFPAALEYLAGPVVIHPHEYYAKAGPKGMNEKPIGSGPFRVVEHRIGKSILLERNPNYFKDSPKPQPKLERLEIRFIPDRQTQTAEMMAGGLDFIMNVPLDQAQFLKASPELKVVSGETMRIAFLQFATVDNSPIPALRDIRVRKAISHAIDRAAIVKNIVGESARVLYTQCFPPQFGCTDEGAPRYDYNPAKAKALLAEAGVPNLTIEFAAYRDRDLAEAIIGMLKAVGINAKLQFMQYAAMRDQVRQSKAGFAFWTWGSFSVNDVSASIPVYFGGTDDDVVRDPEITALLREGDSSIEAAKRKEAYKKAFALIASKAYSVPLWSLPVNYVVANDLLFTAYPDEIPRFWEVSWK
jgi:peptide/nickel transport system substrate-binding protein